MLGEGTRRNLEQPELRIINRKHLAPGFSREAFRGYMKKVRGCAPAGRLSGGTYRKREVVDGVCGVCVDTVIVCGGQGGHLASAGRPSGAT
jgi:hypothetical protein